MNLDNDEAVLLKIKLRCTQRQSVLAQTAERLEPSAQCAQWRCPQLLGLSESVFLELKSVLLVLSQNKNGTLPQNANDTGTL